MLVGKGSITLLEALVSISVRFLSMVYSHQKFAIPEDLYDPKLFNNRELSWLEFNKRVLAEVYDERNPLLERLKFSAIFSNNLDEFFMVRVSGLEQQKAAQVTKRTPDGLNPEEQLEVLSEHLHPVVSQQARYFEEVLRPLLVEEGIYILDHDQLDPGQKQLVRHYFEEMVFPVLTPLAVDPSHPFPYLSNLSLSLAVMVRDPEGGMEHFARVKVPQKILPRFVAIGTQQHYVPLEQIIAAHLDELFHGM
jgi:polyphosphate kinase